MNPNHKNKSVWISKQGNDISLSIFIASINFSQKIITIDYQISGWE